MTVQRLIEPVGDANRWDLPDVQAPKAPGPAHAAQPPSAVEVEAIQARARREGHAEGRRAGYEAGYGEGIEQGRQQGEQAARERVARIQGLLDALAEPVAEIDDDTERELVELTLSLARQVIRRELRTQPGEVVGILREALALLPMAARDVRVSLHPEDVELVREIMGEPEGRWRLEEDPRISRGGCLVSTPQSRIDATVEHRIALLAADLLGDERQAEQEGEHGAVGPHDPEARP